MRKTTFEILADKLKQHGIVAINFERTRIQWNQKSMGSWIWRAWCPESQTDIGSCNTATELIKTKHKLFINTDGDITIG